MESIVQTIKLDIRDFTKLSPQVRFLLVFQLIILFILSILIGVIFSPKFNNQVEDQSGVPVVTENANDNESETDAQNTLSLRAEKDTMAVGETQTIQVYYVGDAATGIDSVVEYVPSVFEVSNIKSSDILDTVLRREIIDGTIYFSGAQSPLTENTSADTTDFAVMTFDITALRPTQSVEITIIEDETIVALKGKNILDSTSGITLKVLQEDQDE